MCGVSDNRHAARRRCQPDAWLAVMPDVLAMFLSCTGAWRACTHSSCLHACPRTSPENHCVMCAGRHARSQACSSPKWGRSQLRHVLVFLAGHFRAALLTGHDGHFRATLLTGHGQPRSQQAAVPQRQQGSCLAAPSATITELASAHPKPSPEPALTARRWACPPRRLLEQTIVVFRPHPG